MFYLRNFGASLDMSNLWPCWLWKVKYFMFILAIVNLLNNLFDLIAGHIHRYKGGHAIEHWKETQHCYSLELETQKVWDYAGDNYVHRLIQSKTDGKLVEYNCHGDHTAESTCSLCSGDTTMNEALLNSKFEAVMCLSKEFVLLTIIK